jgi:ADP-ribosylglycohydrolase
LVSGASSIAVSTHSSVAAAAAAGAATAAVEEASPGFKHVDASLGLFIDVITLMSRLCIKYDKVPALPPDSERLELMLDIVQINLGTHHIEGVLDSSPAHK